MAKQKLFPSKLLNVFKILASESKLDFIKNDQVEISILSGETLLKVSSDDINVPGIPIHENFFEKLSPLEDDFANNNQIQKFISVLSEKESFLRLNHIGFCYFVDSIEKEKQRLLKLANQNNLNLYKEESPDDFMWLFIGRTTKWYDPLIEFVLVEKINDKWKDYWLPHFQIDIDTNLVVDSIETTVADVFGEKVKPYRLIVVNNYVCVLRVRLGIIGGININLDIGTEGRMPRYHREKLLKELNRF